MSGVSRNLGLRSCFFCDTCPESLCITLYRKWDPSALRSASDSQWIPLTRKEIKMIAKIKNAYMQAGRSLGVIFHAPSRAQGQAMLFLFGIGLLTAGLSTGADAQLATTYNDERLSNAINAILVYIEGSFGALVMVAAGIGAILSSAFGQYRAALGLLVVAVGAFILRSILATFFNDETIQA